MKSRLLSLALSVVFATVANAALVARPEVAVTAPTPDIAPFDQANAHLASDGNAFLAVWSDRDLHGSGDIHGARLNADGSRIDAAPIVIAATDADDNRPALAFGAGRYLVDIANGGNQLTRPHVAFNGGCFSWRGQRQGSSSVRRSSMRTVS